ncbi:protein kinase [bacterium]|nr:protein kinase [bacterium]
MIGKTLSHYKIIERIGHGGMGVVYKAEDTRLHRIVAIKMLPPEFATDEKRRHRLLAEAQAASALNHPCICTIHEIEEDGENVFIVMEHIHGRSLKDEIIRGPIPWQRALQIAIQTAAGLEFAHRHQIIHRDLKPANILITEENSVKILDFGLAKMVQQVDEEILSQAVTFEKDLTTTGQVIGTIPYMSPEQISGQKVDARSDLFSFGVTLYEMLSGRMPFHGNSTYELMSSILKETPNPISSLKPDVPLAFQQIVEKAMAKEPKNRYQNSNEILNELRKIEIAQQKDSEKADQHSLAVLYFENMSGSKEEEYFRDGMTEDVITELSKIRNLKVFPRSAVVGFRDKPVSAQQIGQQLNASCVLEGSLRRSGSRIRITAQLVETYGGHSLWAERYDREMIDIFDLQEEIARSIAQALRITLSPQEELAIGQKPTVNAEAYDYYLRGRSYARRTTATDLEYAIQMFEHALALQPDFALAYAGIASVYSFLYVTYGAKSEWNKMGHLAADRALALDPELPEALAAVGIMMFAEGHYEEAIRCTQKAIARKPDCETAYWTLARSLFLSGRYQEAADLVTPAIEASGDDYNVYIPLYIVLVRLGRKEEAFQLTEKYVNVLERHLEMVPEDARARILLANRYAAFGRESDAIRELEKALKLRPDDPGQLYNAACTYGILQRKEEALATLRNAGLGGSFIADWAENDPDLACVHNDPEFIQLIIEIRKSHGS